MENLQPFLDLIQHAYPELKIESAEYDRSGQYNHVLLINRELIFRFPRYAEGVAVLTRETAILDAIRTHVPLPVPHFVYHSPEHASAGEMFVGYRRISGQLLRGETLASIQDIPSIRRIALQIAGFMRALHGVPVLAVQHDLPLEDTRQSWEQRYAEFRDLLYPFMRIDARIQVTTHFERYFDDSDLHEFEPCLRHGDLGPGNVLYDPETHRVSGVIDFGSAGLGDPAVDVAAASCFGEAFMQYYPEAYPHLEHLTERARFIKGTYALEEALHGIKHNDRAAFEAGMAQYI